MTASFTLCKNIFCLSQYRCAEPILATPESTVWQVPHLQLLHVFYSMLHDPSGQVAIGLQWLMRAAWVCHLSHSTGAFILDFIVAKVNFHKPFIRVLLQGLTDEARTCSDMTQVRLAISGLLFQGCLSRVAVQGLLLYQISTSCRKNSSWVTDKRCTSICKCTVDSVTMLLLYASTLPWMALKQEAAGFMSTGQ